MKRAWKHSAVLSFFLLYVAVVLAFAAVFHLYAGAKLREFYLGALAEKMAQQARLASRLLFREQRGAALDRLSRDLGAEIGARITVIAPDGTVLGDSDEASAAMENHADRPEIREAWARGSARSVRRSETLGLDLLYVAVSEPGGRIVRVAVPLEAVEAALVPMRRAAAIGILALAAVGLLLALPLSLRLQARVRRMAEFARRVATADFPAAPLPVGGADELGTLEAHLNAMSRSLAREMSRLTEEKEKIESILRAMTEGVVVIDRRGALVLLNDNARAMLRLPAAGELGGVPLRDLLRQPAIGRLLEEVLACDCSKGCLTRELALDDDRWLRVNAASLRGASAEAAGFVLVFHDVTELKRLETVRADFVANVSHELRTPLAAIKGYADTLLRSPPQDPDLARQFLEVIDRHSERLGRLIEDLLVLSDLESGRIRLDSQAVAVTDVVAGALELFEKRAREKGLRLEARIEDEALAVQGDPDRLQQLLINLVDNAVKYTPAGGRVRLAAEASPASGAARPRVEIRVEDTGCGIPKRDLPRITERFYRVDKARSRELGGTGLGLAIVKHIVQLHEGELNVESEPGKGTRVSVFLPRAEIRSKAAAVRSA
jgi:two-component system phosphate regulon sensor histidine kinase PhoR